MFSKANRLEIWTQTEERVEMAYSRSIYGIVSMLQKVRPANSDVDHLFVGTDRFQYFTLMWNPTSRQFRTVHSFEDISEKHMRDSQTMDRCQIDPNGQYLAMDLHAGVLNLLKIKKPAKTGGEYLDAPDQIRLAELSIRSSTFLHTDKKSPKIAILFNDGKDKVRLVTYRVTDERGQLSEFDAYRDRENDLPNLDLGASHLIPVPKAEQETRRYLSRNDPKAALGGVIIVGETMMTYFDDESKATVEYALDEASIFVAWERYDNLSYLLADDYGKLHLLTLLVEGSIVTGIETRVIGQTSRASVMIYMDNNLLFLGSHSGDSQLIRLDLENSAVEVVQITSNIAPILDFTIMDMGSRAGEVQTNEYSSGQARIVAGSGAFQEGSLRSVRSGVGLEDFGILGDMEDVRKLFSLKSTSESDFVDTLVVSFVTETRIFRFDPDGEVEEVDQYRGFSMNEHTLVALNLSGDRLLQVTESGVRLVNAGSGTLLSDWRTTEEHIITAASANEDILLLSVAGRSLVSLDLHNGLQVLAREDIGSENQISCVSVPAQIPGIGLVGFWNSGSVSILELDTLKVLHGEILRGQDSASVPRDIVMAQVLPATQSGPTLFVAMADGTVQSFNVDKSDYSLSGKKSIVLGTQEATFQVLLQPDGLSNIFATCEHPSLIYGSEGRIVYSAVTADKAVCICSFNAEAYPDSIIVATAEDVKISHIESERTTHVRSLPMGETIRRLAYSATEKVFGIGSIKRELLQGEEIITSSFRLVDEVVFGELGHPYLLEQGGPNGTELIESVIRAEMPDAHGEPAERFIVGTGYLEDAPNSEASRVRGRILVFGIDSQRQQYLIAAHELRGACRCLAILDGKIVAALVKTVIVYGFEERSPAVGRLTILASYRTSTCPIDIAVTGNKIAIADLMKSMSVVEYVRGQEGLPDKLVEVARHWHSLWASAVCHIEDDTFLESDTEGNLLVLSQNTSGVTDVERRHLEITSELNLGELVNRMRKINVETGPDALVEPRAFLATVCFLWASTKTHTANCVFREKVRSTFSPQSCNRHRMCSCVSKPIWLL